MADCVCGGVLACSAPVQRGRFVFERRRPPHWHRREWNHEPSIACTSWLTSSAARPQVACLLYYMNRTPDCFAGYEMFFRKVRPPPVVAVAYMAGTCMWACAHTNLLAAHRAASSVAATMCRRVFAVFHGAVQRSAWWACTADCPPAASAQPPWGDCGLGWLPLGASVSRKEAGVRHGA